VLRNTTMSMLERGLDASSLRHQLLANNVANVNTPGYKRADVDFSQALGSAIAIKSGTLSQTSASHLPGTSGPERMMVTRDNSSTRLDGNSVDIEAEMVHVAENSLYYSALAQQLSDRFVRLKLAITEGRR
jgi:flagellar basal-body rod protein FlgB